MSERPTPETDELIAFGWDAEDRNDFIVPAYFARQLERQRDEAREIVAATLKALPIGYIPSHTPDSLPGRVADLLSQFAEAARQRDELLEACKECDEAFGKFCPDPDSRYGMAWQAVEAAIASGKGENA
jgi:hypothetical protein